MKSNFFLQLIISAVLLMPATSSSAAPTMVKAEFSVASEAVAWAQDKGQTLLTVFKDSNLERRYQKLDKLFVDYVDTDYISRFVVGKYWRTMTAAQQEQYRQLFMRYALALYKTLPLEFASQISYSVGGAVLEGNFIIVNAIVNVAVGQNSAPQNFVTQFRLHKVEDNLKLVDIKLAESSLILAYRTRFYEMIAANDGDIGWFLEDFSDLTVSLEKSNQNRLQTL